LNISRHATLKHQHELLYFLTKVLQVVGRMILLGKNGQLSCKCCKTLFSMIRNAENTMKE